MANTTDLQLLDAVRRFLLAEAQRREILPTDQTAWARLEEKYWPIIRRVCQRHGLHDSQTDELLQTLRIQLWRYLPRFEHTGRRGAFRRWLSRLTRSEIVTQRRKDDQRERRERPTSQKSLEHFAGPRHDPHDEFQQELERETARSILEEMRHHPSERIAYFGELLRLYYLEHEPTEGLASRFGKSPNQIRQDLVRARRELHSRSRRRPDDAS